MPMKMSPEAIDASISYQSVPIDYLVQVDQPFPSCFKSDKDHLAGTTISANHCDLCIAESKPQSRNTWAYVLSVVYRVVVRRPQYTDIVVFRRRTHKCNCSQRSMGLGNAGVRLHAKDTVTAPSQRQNLDVHCCTGDAVAV